MTTPTCAHAPTAVSLFDGIGGFPEALRRVGVRTVATCEIDAAAAGVTVEHFPDAEHFADVTEVTVDDLLRAGFCPVCGVVCAGWPCQDLSLAGRRLGLGGARSGLFWEVVRIARDLRPRWLLLENVPGLLSAVCSCPGLGVCGGGCTDPHTVRGGACGSGRCMELHGGAMGAVLGALAELGYGFAYRVLDAQHFGVPQRRRRVVIVGCLGDWAAPAAVLLEPEGVRGDPGPGGAARPRSAGGTGRSAVGSRREVVSTLQSGGSGVRGYRIDAEAAAGGHLIGFDAAQITSNENRSNPQPGGPQPPLAATGAPHVAYQQQGTNVGPMGALRRGNGNETGGVPFIVHALTPEGADASKDGAGRGSPSGPTAFDWQAAGDPRIGPNVSTERTSPITTTRADAVHEPAAAAVRRLTPMECERLQGFPDEWTAVVAKVERDGNRWRVVRHGVPQADAPRYRLLGNSVAVPVFEWVSGRIVAHIRSS